MLCAFEELLASTLQRINPSEKGNVRERNQGDVSPKAGVLRHLFRFGFGGDADLRNLRAS